MNNDENPKTQTYVTTELAGKRVAGRVVEKPGEPGQELPLTELEAEHELREGTIVLKGKTLNKAFTTPSKRLDDLRDQASTVAPPATDAPPAPDKVQPAAPRPNGGPASPAPGADAKTGSKGA